jgi:hypothetical protein
MMHKKRRWCVSPVSDAAELARKLTGTTWTLCTGFELNGYLFLNDATSEDGAQEYAVVKQVGPNEFVQLESITFSWCTDEEALAFVQQAISGGMDASEFTTKVEPRIESPADHRRYHLCA